MEIIYKTSRIKKILNNIYNLCDIPVFFRGINSLSQCGTASPLRDFCSQVENIPELHKKCVACDKELLERSKKSRKSEWHLCHAGLFDGIIPVIKDGITAGFIFWGHVRTDDSVCSVPPENLELRELFNERPYYSLKNLKSLSFLLSNINFDDCIHIDTDKNFEERIMMYIKENLYQNLSVKKICEEFHISRSYFYKIWNNNNEENFLNYVSTRRISRAKKILRETDLPIYKVAESVGIKSYGIFCKAFQKQIGITPTQYRQRTNETNAS